MNLYISLVILVVAGLAYAYYLIRRSRAKTELAQNPIDRNLLFECGWVDYSRTSMGFPPRPLHNVPPLRPGGKVRFKPPLKDIELNELKVRIGQLGSIRKTSPYHKTAHQMIKEIILHIRRQTEHRNTFREGHQPIHTDLSPTAPPIHPSQH